MGHERKGDSVKPTPATIALIFGCTKQQAAAGLRRNANSMRKYTANDLRRMGKTRKQVNAMADDYETRGTL